MEQKLVQSHLSRVNLLVCRRCRRCSGLWRRSSHTSCYTHSERNARSAGRSSQEPHHLCHRSGSSSLIGSFLLVVLSCPISGAACSKVGGATVGNGGRAALSQRVSAGQPTQLHASTLHRSDLWHWITLSCSKRFGFLRIPGSTRTLDHVQKRQRKTKMNSFSVNARENKSHFARESDLKSEI